MSDLERLTAVIQPVASRALGGTTAWSYDLAIAKRSAAAVLNSDWLAEHDRQAAEKAPLVRALREFYDRGEGVSWRDLQVLLAMSEPNVVRPEGDSDE